MTMNKPLSLMIVEPYASGHRMQYVRRIVNAAVRQGTAVAVATRRETMEHPVFQVMLEETECGFETLLLPNEGKFAGDLTMNSDFPLQKAHFELYREFHRRLPQERQNVPVLIPYLNLCDKMIGAFGSPFGNAPWGGIVMRDTFHYTAMGVLAPKRRENGLKKLLFHRILKNRTLRKVFTIDESLTEYIGKHSPAFVSKMGYVPEPVQMDGDVSRAEARRQFGIPDDKFVVLVYGVISGRKRPDALLEAIQKDERLSSVCLLIAGPQRDDSKALLTAENIQALKGRIFQKDAYMIGADEFAAFRAADAVWLGYREHYTMSAVLIQSGAMGLPVLACREGLIGWVTKRYEAGIVLDASDNNAVCNALYEMMTNSDLRRKLGNNGKRLSERHAASEFAQAILTGMLGTKIADNIVR